MFYVPLILAIFFIILILSFPYIVKKAFKFSDFLGFSIGLICSVITLLVEVIIVIGGICLLVFVIDERGFSSKSSQSPDQAIIDIDINMQFTIMTSYSLIIGFKIVLLKCFMKKVTTPDYNYNSIFMFISGYSTFIYGILFLLVIILCLISNIIREKIPSFKEFDDAWNEYLILYDLFVFGLLLRFTGISILIMIYLRKFNGEKPFNIAFAIMICPLVFMSVGFFIRKIILIKYPGFAFDIASVIVGTIYYFKYKNQTQPQNSALLNNPGLDMQPHS